MQPELICAAATCKETAWGSSEDVSFYIKIHVTSFGLFEWAAVRLSSPRRTRKSTHSELTMWQAVLLTHLVVLSLQSENCDPKWTFLPRTHSCYLKANRALEWREAQEYCESFGENSNLASVLNRDELEGVQLLVDDFLTWIGLSLNDTPTWTDGNNVGFTNFLTGEPSNAGHCVAWVINDEQNGWRSIACNYSQFFICKQAARGPSPIIQRGTDGDFFSPGYPGFYENNISSYYFIEVEADQRVIITFTDVDTEPNRDVISVFDGFDQNSATLLRLSGQVHQRSVISRGNKVMISFKSDDSDASTGFRASWVAKGADPAIEHLTEPKGIVRSDGYPGPIPMFTVQRLLINCPEENHVYTDLMEIQTSVLDRLRFYDEPPGLYSLPSFSGTATSAFSSTSPTVFVRFDAVDGANESINWKFKYECVRNDGLGELIDIP